jgi:hypothetical protein
MNKIFKLRFLGIAAFLAVMAVFSVVVTLLWNALMPDIFGLPALNYWQSLGLSVLARLLFGGLDGMGRRGFMRHSGHSGNNRVFHHKRALREKWMNMSEEERNAFVDKEKEFMRSHRGFSHFHEFFDDESRGR